MSLAPTDHASPAPAASAGCTRPYTDWIGSREVASLGTNAGAVPLAYQGWMHFKEAFAPELVHLAIDSHPSDVRHVFDPFGGSGTTALTTRFLGVNSTCVEVNPFLADVIQAKVTAYNADTLARTFASIVRGAARERLDAASYFNGVPETFLEPGRNHRWVFDVAVADALASYLNQVDLVEDEASQRLFRVLLGGILVGTSNVVVNGKGRRYRRSWSNRTGTWDDVSAAFAARAKQAIADVHRYRLPSGVHSNVTLGDSRTTNLPKEFDVAVFSPPYPNSFDYTDVYNVELWMLGYLNSTNSNRLLRTATLTSHVQLYRPYAAPPTSSPTLNATLLNLDAVRGQLWSRWIPEMVGAYFADMAQVVARIACRLTESGRCWMVVGDSRYGGVFVPTARILEELTLASGWTVHQCKPFRSMRSSAQHGGRAELAESLLIVGR